MNPQQKEKMMQSRLRATGKGLFGNAVTRGAISGATTLPWWYWLIRGIGLVIVLILITKLLRR